MIAQNFPLEELSKAAASNITLDVNQYAYMQSRQTKKIY